VPHGLRILNVYPMIDRTVFKRVELRALGWLDFWVSCFIYGLALCPLVVVFGLIASVIVEVATLLSIEYVTASLW